VLRRIIDRMKTLNVIGAGRVGSALAGLWQRSQVFSVQDVLDGTLAGAREAVQVIGGGEPAESLAAMRPADAWMVTTPDRRVRQIGVELLKTELLRARDVVFHCSGSMSSAELAAAHGRGAHVASVHPLKSFADPREAMRTFAGTFCAAEGDADALALLTPAFEKVGARISPIDARYKTIYHAASVIVSNYLTALIETGLRCYEKAAVPRATAMMMIEPIVLDTVQNIFHLGTVRALTGPISRGDDGVVERHLEALAAWHPAVTDVYRTLGIAAADLARQQSEGHDEALARIEALLKR
jgi:predicted short-subunit dehydrogenase-like oxidoreductase (DUF2520 family)